MALPHHPSFLQYRVRHYLKRHSDTSRSISSEVDNWIPSQRPSMQATSSWQSGCVSLCFTFFTVKTGFPLSWCSMRKRRREAGEVAPWSRAPAVWPQPSINLSSSGSDSSLWLLGTPGPQVIHLYTYRQNIPTYKIKVIFLRKGK